MIAGLGACGERSESPRPEGPLAEALASIGGGGANGSLGVGWADPRLVKAAGAEVTLIDAALGPNADTVVEAAPRLRRRFGIDPLAAERLVSVGGSYAFGLRIDGVDGRRLGRALVASGGQVHREGRLELVQIGDYAVVPQLLLDAGVRLGAFGAFSREVALLAISETARESLLGGGDRLIDEPIYRAAADCLGDVVAARMVPDRLLLSTEVGVDLVALGVQNETEVLCALGASAERAGAISSALEASLAPGEVDPVSGEPLSDSVAGVEVTTESYDGIALARAEVTPARGRPAGFFFGAVSRGSLVPLISGAP